MSTRQTSMTAADGGVRLTRNVPSCGRAERAMQVSATLPRALFKEPTLRANITVDAGAVADVTLDLKAAAAQIRAALGVDIDLSITTPEENP